MIDATGMPQTAVVIGGSSDIARETLRLLAGRRLRRVIVAGRNAKSLDALADELGVLGVTAESASLDVTDVIGHDGFAVEALARLGEIDLVLVTVGDLGTASLDELDAVTVSSLLATNFTGPAAVTFALAKVLRAQGWGRIVVLSSVAGVRVRKANFVYGSAKAGLDGFALGLADALEGTGVEVTVVRPGFVRTKMTRGMKPAPFAVDAVTVAEATIRALETGEAVAWVPAALGPIFAALRMLPRALWRRIPS
jgi:decaprenylphospho-beta-D-erythro-pentofuranosid-2-ulose 2-reductase